MFDDLCSLTLVYYYNYYDAISTQHNQYNDQIIDFPVEPHRLGLRTRL